MHRVSLVDFRPGTTRGCSTFAVVYKKIILLVLRTTNGATTPSFVTPAYFIIQKTAGSWVMSSVEEEQEKERGK